MVATSLGSSKRTRTEPTFTFRVCQSNTNSHKLASQVNQPCLNQRIYRRLHEPILQKMGLDYNGQKKFKNIAALDDFKTLGRCMFAP